MHAGDHGSAHAGMGVLPRRAVLALLPGLAACAAGGGSDYTEVQTGLGAYTPWRAQAVRVAAQPAFRLPAGECVPFARTLSGVTLVGDARTWWAQAASRFARGIRPAPGAVMVFRTHPDMPLGHVAVVTALLDSRSVLVAHSNWDGGLGKGRISLDQPVRDVSARNDWSMVRVWHEATRALGPNAWALEGFIFRTPPRPGQLMAAL
jgi:surface antigen